MSFLATDNLMITELERKSFEYNTEIVLSCLFGDHSSPYIAIACLNQGSNLGHYINFYSMLGKQLLLF